MPRVKTTHPRPSREKGQRSLDLPLYLDRIIPAISHPEWLDANLWRRIVLSQPFATVFRDTLISNILALDWKIEPKDSTKRDELKEDIKYYTDFFQNTGEYDYSDIVEWVGTDLLDLPFGGACEVGREYDSPDGKVVWIEPLDAATLFPTLNSDFPVGQRIQEFPANTVYFPYYAINRIYFSPRTEIKRKGWGMPPPEKIYLAIEMLRRGDIYYASLLVDTPEAGILDLIDMSKDSAEQWVDGWKTLLTGIDPLKIPVLYEHESAAKWIPFTRPPADIMFDKAIMKYVGLVAAGYQMSASDIGFSPVSSGGETLAGSIRQERKSRKTGVNKAKRKFITFFNFMLPKELEFKYIDLDDEVSVAVGRSRLANATAIQALIDRGVLTPNEGRQQLMADGLITVSIPETIDGGDEVHKQLPFSGGAERPGLLGRPIAPSQGGHGEVKSELMDGFDVIDASIINDSLSMEEMSGTEMDLAKAFAMVARALLVGKNQPINVFVPKSEQQPPNITVNVPSQEVPQITVSIPEQTVPAPIVNVSVPEQQPPVVNIRGQRRSIGRQKVKRDQDGNLVETITETEYKYDGE